MYHFDGALKITFNDGKKFEDLSKVRQPKLLCAVFHFHSQQLLYLIHDFFNQAEDSSGYVFMCLFRKYMELDMYMSFDLHTHDTLLSAEKTLKEFGSILTVSLSTLFH